MNYKKLFFGMMLVAIVATMCVGFTSCSEDEKPEVEDMGYDIMYQWYNVFTEDNDYDSRYGIEFTRNKTYSYITPNESATGDFKIFEIQKSTGVVSCTWRGNEFERELDYKLYKMDVIGSSNFDQMWVYLLSHQVGGIIVHFYSNNELIQKPQFGR